MILKGLNERQIEAATQVSGPVLILAGPGSGKTRVLTHRIAHLINEGVKGENILAVTFTNKAAAEMKGRIEKLIPLDPKRDFKLPTLGTFHSVCARLLRTEAPNLGYNRDFTIYDDKDSLNVIKSAMKDLGISEEQFNPYSISEAISQAKNELADADEYAARAKDFFPQVVSKIYSEYQARLKAASAMDFDDLIMLVVRLFQGSSETLLRYQEKFKYILVDEYQDTNHAQYLLINLLAKKYRNLFVIGDEAQSIYSWRGADFRNILNFEKDYPEAKVILLEQNYRSSQNIIGAAHNVIIKNKHRKEKNLWTENKEGEPITIFSAEDEREEGYYIIEEIVKRKRADRNLKLADFAVLYRTNAQSRVLEEIFLKTTIPYKVVGTLKFYDRKEIKDILAYLRFINNPKDIVSLERIINVPPRGFGKSPDCRELLHLGHESGISKMTPQRMKAWKSFSEMADSLREISQKEVLSELLRKLLIKTEYEAYTRDKSEAGESRWENIKELFSVTKQYDAMPPGQGLQAFLEQAALMSNQDEVETQKDVVNLMTLHCAKGLEFPVVFIAGMEEGIFPHSRSLIDNWQMEEERRLCYVGITRAKEKLYLLCAKTRQLFGSKQANPPSRFLFDIPAEMAEFQNFDSEELISDDGLITPF